MEWPYVFLLGYTPVALLLVAPLCAALARRKNRDAETWFLIGAVGGPLGLAWIGLLPARARPNDASALELRRRPTPPHRIPVGRAVLPVVCVQCGRSLATGHLCRPEEVEDRIQRRWTVRVGGQRIIGPL